MLQTISNLIKINVNSIGFERWCVIYVWLDRFNLYFEQIVSSLLIIMADTLKPLHQNELYSLFSFKLDIITMNLYIKLSFYFVWCMNYMIIMLWNWEQWTESKSQKLMRKKWHSSSFSMTISNFRICIHNYWTHCYPK